MPSTDTPVSGPHPVTQYFEYQSRPPATSDEAPKGKVGPGERKPHALVVDDSPDITFMFGILLEQAGYDVTTENSAIDALEAARARQFDLVVSDIGMPDMNGYELARELRTLPGYETVPMVAVTGFAQYSDRDRAVESGFNMHINKPVDPEKFVELVSRL
jgi:CheY-like chemotaxis protein